MQTVDIFQSHVENWGKQDNWKLTFNWFFWLLKPLIWKWFGKCAENEIYYMLDNWKSKNTCALVSHSFLHASNIRLIKSFKDYY